VTLTIEWDLQAIQHLLCVFWLDSWLKLWL